jgi:hypothetical protein
LGAGEAGIRKILMRLGASIERVARFLAIAALAQGWGHERAVNNQLVRMVNQDPDWLVRFLALPVLARRFPNDEGVSTLLRRSSLEQHEKDGSVRSIAIWLLTSRPRPVDLKELQRIATVDSAAEVRKVAMEVLVTLWPEDPMTRTVLRDLAKNEPLRTLKRKAAKLLNELKRPAET